MTSQDCTCENMEITNDQIHYEIQYMSTYPWRTPKLAIFAEYQHKSIKDRGGYWIEPYKSRSNLSDTMEIMRKIIEKNMNGRRCAVHSALYLNEAIKEQQERIKAFKDD